MSEHILTELRELERSYGNMRVNNVRTIRRAISEIELLRDALKGMVEISKFWADEWDLDIEDFEELETAKEILK